MARRVKGGLTDKQIQRLCGWAKPEVVKAANAVFAPSLPKFHITGADPNEWKGKKRMLYEVNRKVLGKDTPNYPQEIGDCVSFACKNVLEYLQCAQILLDGADHTFRFMFPPYFYGTSRVLVGQRQIGRGDGSTGVWCQEAVKKYGVIASDEPGVPAYAGSVAKAWGWTGPPENLIPIGQKNLVKTTAKVTEASDLASGLYHGFLGSVCSNQGFEMQARSDGFHYPRGSWGHCMALIGYEDHPKFGLYFIILNSWGDQFGRLKDFTTGEELPIGVLRVHANVVDSMLKADGGDSFLYSQFDGFPGNGERLDRALFDVVGASIDHK